MRTPRITPHAHEARSLQARAFHSPQNGHVPRACIAHVAAWGAGRLKKFPRCVHNTPSLAWVRHFNDGFFRETRDSRETRSQWMSALVAEGLCLPASGPGDLGVGARTAVGVARSGGSTVTAGCEWRARSKPPGAEESSPI